MLAAKVSSGAKPGRVGVMVTNGATHPAQAWADVTVKRIVSIDPAMTGDRLKTALGVRRAVRDALGEAFDKVKSAATREAIDTRALAEEVIGELARVTIGTDWAMALDNPAIRKAIYWDIVRALSTIVRNEIEWPR